MVMEPRPVPKGLVKPPPPPAPPRKRAPLAEVVVRVEIVTPPDPKKD